MVKTTPFEYPKSQLFVETRIISDTLYSHTHWHSRSLVLLPFRRDGNGAATPGQLKWQHSPKMRGKSSPSTPTPLQMLSPPESESDTTKRELQIVSTSPFRLPDDWFVEFKTRRNNTASPGRVDKVLSLSLSLTFIYFLLI